MLFAAGSLGVATLLSRSQGEPVELHRADAGRARAADMMRNRAQ